MQTTVGLRKQLMMSHSIVLADDDNLRERNRFHDQRLFSRRRNPPFQAMVCQFS